MIVEAAVGGHDVTDGTGAATVRVRGGRHHGGEERTTTGEVGTVSLGAAIGWTEATFNPWWGCARVSPACVNCYADTWARRTGHSDLWHREGDRRFFGEAHWREPLDWNRKAERRGRPILVFCASMADVFEDHPALPPERDRLWELIERTPWLIWQLLTKRPENVLSMAPWRTWPENVWVGTSVENKRWADARIPVLLEVPASIRFLSCEPLLGPIDLRPWLPREHGFAGTPLGPGRRPMEAIDWIITGGESGGPPRRSLVMDDGISPNPKPEALGMVRGLRDQCVGAGVPFFFKQWGGRTPKAGGRELDGRTWDELPALTPGRDLSLARAQG